MDQKAEPKVPCTVWGQRGINWQSVTVNFIAGMFLYRISDGLLSGIETRWKASFGDPKFRQQFRQDFREHPFRRSFLKPPPVETPTTVQAPPARPSGLVQRVLIEKPVKWLDAKIWNEGLQPTSFVRQLPMVIGTTAVVSAIQYSKDSGEQGNLTAWSAEYENEITAMRQRDIRFQGIWQKAEGGELSPDDADAAALELVATVADYEGFMTDEYHKLGADEGNRRLIEGDHTFFRPIQKWMKNGVGPIPGYDVPASAIARGPLPLTDRRIRELFEHSHSMFRKFALIRDNNDILITAGTPEQIGPKLKAKWPDLAKSERDLRSVTVEMISIGWGPDSAHARTLIDLAKKGVITREDLALRLQDDASWVCQFQDMKSLGIDKFKPVRNEQTGAITLSHDHLKIEEIRQGTLSGIPGAQR